ncbi:aminotransferase class I/II-fold pyridoxal phosphate-dependent enzyme, partial [Brucella sp. C7-11G]
SVCGIAQAAAKAALDGDQDFVADAAHTFSRRADLVSGYLGQIAEIEFLKPEGAFYAFIGVEQLIGRQTPSGVTLNDDTDIASYLLNAFGVSSVPGIAFCAPGFIRLSIAASDEELIQACSRLKDMVASLS